MIHILAAIGAGFTAIYARLEITCRGLEKIKAVLRITHPEVAKKLRL